MSTPKWKLTLVRHDGDGQAVEELTLRSDDLGDALGEALNSGIRWEGDNSRSPLEELTDIVHALTANWVTFEADELSDLSQVLLRFSADDDKDREALRKAMLAVATPEGE